jgi:hypothetical protein
MEEKELELLQNLSVGNLNETEVEDLNKIENKVEDKNEIEDEHINPLIENELLKTLGQFFNEIDLVFDNVDKNVVGKLYKFLESLQDVSNMKDFVKTSVPILKKYEEKISYITTSKKKIKSSDYDFLNEIKLFNDILDFSVFACENKGTKKSIVKYLYNIYMSIFILSFGVASDGNVDTFAKEISQFMKGIQDRIINEEIEKEEQKQQRQQRKMEGVQLPRSLPTQLPTQMDVGGMGNLLNSLMSNGDIMSLATDLSKDIERENIDPMMLLSSLMSGRPDSKVQNLVSNITNKIETKINNGEIDKTQLEQQANTVLNSLQNSGDFGKMFGNSI